MKLARVRSASFLNPGDLFNARAHAYSQVAVVPNTSGLILVAGQSGHTADGKLEREFEQQLQQALKNVFVALAAAGASAPDVIQTTIYVAEYEQAQLALIVSAVQRCWEAPQPPLNLIPVPRLALDGMLVEISVAAVPPAAAAPD